MLLRAKITRLAQQFETIRAYLRDQSDLLREFAHDVQSLKSQSAAEIHSTAIHEAGHAALAIALDLDCLAVSIIPDFRDGSAGGVLVKKYTATADVHMAGREAFYLRHAMFCYAGAEAVRQLIPTDADPDAGASSDKRKAAKLIIDQIGGHRESTDFLFSLAKRRCALLVAHYQPEIRALAGALEAKWILSGEVARKVFMRSLTKRGGQLMIFETDPMLRGPGCDEAFQSFMRRLNLPGLPGRSH